MSRIPAPALWLGLAGLLPFLWGAFSALLPDVAAPVSRALGPRFTGVALLTGYGTIILAFMSGVIWGFATRAAAAGPTALYALSVVPALWALFAVGAPGPGALLALLAGFIGLLAIDAYSVRAGLAPAWWMRLRLGLTATVALCLVVGTLA